MNRCILVPPGLAHLLTISGVVTLRTSGQVPGIDAAIVPTAMTAYWAWISSAIKDEHDHVHWHLLCPMFHTLSQYVVLGSANDSVAIGMLAPVPEPAGTQCRVYCRDRAVVVNVGPKPLHRRPGKQVHPGP